MGYTKDVLKGFSWIGSFRVATRVISFGKTLILARILTPSQFGFFGIGAIVLALSELLTETGINVLLVQKKEISKEYLDTAWVISIIRGFIIGTAMFLLAAPIGAFFLTPEAYVFIVTLSIVPVVRGFINPLRVQLVKNLRFKADFLYNTLLFFVEAVVAILACFYTGSAIGMAYGLIASAFLDVILSFILFKPYPKLQFTNEIFKDIVKHGKWLTANGVMNYLYQNIDNIVIGKILGAASLGLYDVIYKISILPVTEVADVVGKVTFPVYVKINKDISRMRRAYIRSSVAVLLASLILAIIIIMFAREVIIVLLGQQWVQGVTFLYILAVLGVFRALFSTVIYPLYALQKQNYVTLLTFVALLAIGVTILPLTTYLGLQGASFSALFGAVVATPPALFLVLKELQEKT